MIEKWWIYNVCFDTETDLLLSQQFHCTPFYLKIKFKFMFMLDYLLIIFIDSFDDILFDIYCKLCDRILNIEFFLFFLVVWCDCESKFLLVKIIPKMDLAMRKHVFRRLMKWQCNLWWFFGKKQQHENEKINGS